MREYTELFLLGLVVVEKTVRLIKLLKTGGK